MAALGWLQNLALGGSPEPVIVTQTQVGRVAVSSSQIVRDSQGVFDIDKHVQVEIDKRLVANPTGTYKDLFSPAYANGGDNTWNPDCWAADLDFTGLSPWNSQQSYFGGILISRRHVLFAWHDGDYTPEIGTTIVFVKADGSECSRTVVNRISVWSLSDLGICYLDQDVPSDVAFYKYASYWWYDPDFGYYDLTGAPIVICDQEEKALVGEIFGSVYYPSDTPYAGIKSVPGTSPQDDYWEDLIEGDSGHPSFLVVDDQLILIGIHSRAETGQLIDSDVAFFQWVISDAMSSIDDDDTGYQLTEFDFDAFIARMRREPGVASRIGRVAVGSNTIARV